MVLRFQSNGKRVFPVEKIRSRHEEMPIHIAARNQRGNWRTLDLLHRSYPQSSRMSAKHGLPIHYVCRFSRDPDALAAVLASDPGVVNIATDEGGFTPLHIVAYRSEQRDDDIFLVPLDEDAQVAMIRLLLEAGADRSLRLTAEKECLPASLLQPTRRHLKAVLAPPADADSALPPQHSPAGNGSPGYALSEMSPASSYTGGASMSLYGNGGGCFQQAPSPFGTATSVGSSVMGSGRTGSGGAGSGSEDSSDDGNNIDAIAEVLFSEHHPVIEAALNNLEHEDFTDSGGELIRNNF